MTAEPHRGPSPPDQAGAGPVPRNAAYDTGYHAHYVRLGGARGRFTSFDPLGPGLAAGDGAPGGMTDHDHAAGKPSRREKEIAAWLTADVPDQLPGAQFDIATLLAKIEQLRDALWMGTRNMIEAEHRASEAKQKGALGQLASQYALLMLASAALEHDNATLRAAAAICSREHCEQPRSETAATADGTGQPSATFGADFPGVDLKMLAYDIADMLDRNGYPIDADGSHILPALPAFIAAIMANAPADTGIAGEPR